MKLTLFVSALALTLSLVYSPAHALLGVLIGCGIVACVAVGLGLAAVIRTVMERD